MRSNTICLVSAKKKKKEKKRKEDIVMTVIGWFMSNIMKLKWTYDDILLSNLNKTNTATRAFNVFIYPILGYRLVDKMWR